MINPNLEAEMASLLSQGLLFEKHPDLPSAETHYRIHLTKYPAWPEGWFRLGLVCLKQKRLREASDAFEKTIALGHRTAEAWNYTGIALGWMDQTRAAANAFQQAIQIQPQLADAHLNLGIALKKLKQILGAKNSLETAFGLDPNNPSVLSNLSNLHVEMGDLHAAVECLERAVRIAPNNLQAVFSLAVLYRNAGRIRDAEQAFRFAIQTAPTFADAHLGLGVLLAEQRCFDQAVAALNQALALLPDSPLILANLGNAERELGQFERAEMHLSRAVALDAGNPRIQVNLATLRLEQRRLKEAEQLFLAAISLDGTNANAHAGLAAVLAEFGQYEAAKRHNLHAIQVDPNNASAHHNLSLIHLVQGDWSVGFQEFEWRWRTNKFVDRGFRAPVWDGRPLREQTLLIYCEQGFGDTIQFCRYIEMARARTERVVLDVPRPLHPLLSTCKGVDRLVATGDSPGEFHSQIPLMSLPRIFSTRVDRVPCSIPYLRAEPTRIDHWKRTLGESHKMRVGLAWRGSANYGRNNERSIPLSRFRPLAALEDIELISLHRNDVATEMESNRPWMNIRDLGPQLDADGAFVDTAALMESLDLVISIDSAAIHLAGALGRPAWLLSHFVPDWRWLLNREDTPWYPSVRIFRQSNPGDWDEVIRRVCLALQSLDHLS